ncbi:nucleotidyltransferase domain-containing protein, partial [Desulfobacterales bacterium HSG17]|nr:nucleotidyltransferase domain-containing protein [Desulfobacterales bacterium HSG17]
MQDKNVLFALIFGSYAKGCPSVKSDLDIALYLIKPIKGIELLDFINKLSKITAKDVDIVVLNHASAFLRHQVMKHAHRLFIKDKNI